LDIEHTFESQDAECMPKRVELKGGNAKFSASAALFRG